MRDGEDVLLIIFEMHVSPGEYLVSCLGRGVIAREHISDCHIIIF